MKVNTKWYHFIAAVVLGVSRDAAGAEVVTPAVFYKGYKL